MYKQYIVRQHENQEILCEPYIVQQDDYVLKLFRQKGEISHQDFPEFLGIFKRINPHVSDVNTILAGQHILIPLTKLKPDSLPGQSTGIVKIPFISISSLPKLLTKHSSTHEVKKGEVVSGIIAAKFKRLRTSKEYNETLQIFKLINPQIADINQIYPGQEIRVPDPSLRNQPWYASLFDRNGHMVQPAFEEDATAAGHAANEASSSGNSRMAPEFSFQRVATALGANLLNRGVYYFPGEGGTTDIKIDLARSPMVEFSNGAKILFHENERLSPEDQKQLARIWKNLRIVPVSPGASADAILNDILNEQKATARNNRLAFRDSTVRVEIHASWLSSGNSSGSGTPMQRIGLTLIDSPAQKTPESIRRYLEQKNISIRDIFKSTSAQRQHNAHSLQKAASHNTHQKPVVINATRDHKAFVRDLSKALGFRYASDIRISFPYHGIQIEAVSNLISSTNGQKLLADFGELYGDALSAVKNSGFNIIALHPDDKISTIIRKIMTAFDIPLVENPTFWAAQRPPENNISLTLTGFKLGGDNGNEIIIAKAPVDENIIQFLAEQNIKVIMIELP